MHIVLYTLGSWLTFLFVDFLFFLFSSMKDATTLNLKFIPDLFSVVFIIICYMGIGLFIGICVKGCEALGKTKTCAHKNKWLCLAVTLSFAVNCLMNIVLFYKQQTSAIPFASVPYLRAVMLLIIIIISIAVAVKFSHVLKKSPVITLFSVCTSGEVFLSIIREGFFPGGCLKDSFAGYNSLTVLSTAVVLGGLVFSSIYFYAPRLFSRIRGRGLTVFLSLCMVYLFHAGTVHTSYAGRISETPRRPNVILIILDTLRADHLSCYGYGKNTTPNIDAFAAQAVRYSHAYAAASFTLPSIATIVTGLYPCGHNANRTSEPAGNKDSSLIQILYDQGLNDNNTTFAEFLKKAGYSTAGITSNIYIGRSYGFQQGFDYFDDDLPSVAAVMPMCAAVSFLNLFFPIDDFLTSRGHNGQRIAAQINTSAIGWLNRYDTTNPFFLMLHYFDVHHPYFPESLGMQSVPFAIKNRYARCSNYGDIEKQIVASVMSGHKTLLQDEKDFLIDNYDRELLVLDKKVGELFSYLRKNNLYDESLIIITADHGESFGEHNLMLHGICLYEDNLHVPLIVKYPLSDQKKGTVDSPVSLTGIVPTVLSYLSINTPDFIQGASFDDPQKQTVLAMHTHNPVPVFLLPEPFNADAVSLLKNGYKLISFANGHDELYYLDNDPYETADIIARESSTGAALRADVSQYIEKYTVRRPHKKTPQPIDKATIENLRGLGYVK
jgi:arylsulfatase A-like enzyme